jgi:CRP-like cAMP-binding protein
MAIEMEARANKFAWLSEFGLHLQRFLLSNAMSLYDWDRLLAGVRLQRVRHFNPGESIVDDQEKLSLLYYIEEGEVQILKGGTPLATLYPGATFGELSFLDYPARRTSAAGMQQQVSEMLHEARAFSNTISMCRCGCC